MTIHQQKWVHQEGDNQSFSAIRSELPMLYFFLSFAAIELIIVHFLVNLWSTTAAYVLTAVTALGIAQIIIIVRRVKKLSVLLTDEGLLIRSAKGFEISLPWSRVAIIEPIGFVPAPSGKDVISTALIAHPNVHVRLKETFQVKHFGRLISGKSITIRLDRPDAMIDAATVRLVAP